MPQEPTSSSGAPLALITGGSGDLARAIAHSLEHAGYLVLSPGRDSLDVCDPASITAFFRPLHHLRLLVNNAGITADHSFARLGESDWDRVLDTNLKGAFLCARTAAKRMRSNGGHIVNIGSFSALSPPFGQSNYAASKAGLIGLTHSLASEFGPSNIRVNCVLPGFLETRMTKDVPAHARERALGAHALGRFNTTADAARFIAFLDSMPHISGQIFQLDSRITPWA